MDIFALNPAVLIASLMLTATPILLAAIGEMVVEKSGVLNLGVEGMMIVGAVSGFIVTIESQSVWLGFMGAIVAGVAVSLTFALLTQFFLANQVASGLALTLFGLGLSAMMGHTYTGLKPPNFEGLDLPILQNIPYLGEMLFRHDAIVYFSLFLVLAVFFVLKYTRAGLILRACGENHDAAHALGYKVVRVRVIAIMFGGACAGLGGAYLSLVRVPQWTEGMTAGAGWIALAIVVFASWRPWRVLLGAYLFGGITILQLNLQAIGVTINVVYLSMAPYLVTIIVLVLMSAERGRNTFRAPHSLGKIFYTSH